MCSIGKRLAFTIKLKFLSQVIGLLVAGSCFEDVVFQTGLCISGSLKGVLVGSHYNRALTVHNAYLEALERLQLSRFLYEKKSKIPETFKRIAADPNPVLVEISDDDVSSFIKKYERYRSNVRAGNAGQTAKFWMLYLDLMQTQSMAHQAVQENDMDMLIAAWMKFIPMYFALNKMNYARYGSYYVYNLTNMESIYPGLSRFGPTTQSVCASTGVVPSKDID